MTSRGKAASSFRVRGGGTGFFSEAQPTRRNGTSPGLTSLWSLTFRQMEEILHSRRMAKLPVHSYSPTCNSWMVRPPSAWEIVVGLYFHLTKKEFFARA